MVSQVRLTCCLDRRNKEVASEDLSEFGAFARLSCEHTLKQANEVMRQRCRDEETVQRHLRCLGVDMSPGEELCYGGFIVGRPAHREPSKMTA